MVPQPVSPGGVDDANCRSHDPSLDLQDLSLTTALRISISGENIELGSDSMVDSLAEKPVESSLMLPDDMPVDLRVKFAIAMINLGKTIPEV